MPSDKFIKNKDMYLAYNAKNYESFCNSLNKTQKIAFQSLPLLFHINNSNIPGYNGMGTPCGIKNYEIDNEVISSLNKINNKFDVDKIDEIIVSAIEGVYFQESYKTGELILWVIYDSNLMERGIDLLKKKALNIKKWLNKNELRFIVNVTNHKNIANVYYDSVSPGFHIDKVFFLEEFYAESIVIAGKLPFWWIVSNATHKGENSVSGSDADNVDRNDEYIDFSSFNILRAEDYYSAAIWYLLNLNKSPMTTWLDLLLLLYRLVCDLGHETYASHLKGMVHSGYFTELEIDEKAIYATYLNNVINELIENNESVIDDKFSRVLCHNYHSEQKIISGKSIYDYLYEIRTDKKSSDCMGGLGVTDYIKSLESIYNLTEHSFSLLQEKIGTMDNMLYEKIQDLSPISERLLLKLNRDSKNLHILSGSRNNDFTLDRVIIEYVKKGITEEWKLLAAENNGKSKEIKSFGSIIELLVWSYINQIIDTSSQISAHCPAHIIGPLDIVNIIKLLASSVDIKSLDEIALDAYSRSPVPIKSIIFIDMSFGSDIISHVNSEAQINQLIIYNNGEFHTLQYKGYDNFISCIHNWYNMIGDSLLEYKPTMQVFSIKSGKTQELKASVSNLMHELGDYFDSHPIKNTRTILKKDGRYYVSHITSEGAQAHSFDNIELLFAYLENPLVEFTSCIFTDTFEQDVMLGYLLKQNKKNTIQLFYYIEGKEIRTFIFDENGALFTYDQLLFKRQSFINHWMLFLYNMKKKHPGNMPVEINQLIKLDNITYEHLALKGSMLPADEKYYALELEVSDKNNDIVISFTCENEKFSSNDQGSDIYNAISNFIANKLSLSKDIPVYISNIEIPDKLLGNNGSRKTYLFDYLKYKRNVESRLNDKINRM